MAKGGSLEALYGDAEVRLGKAKDAGLKPCVDAVQEALEHARSWVMKAMENPATVEAGARRFALTLGRSYELALLVEHAQWCLDNGHGPRAMAAARRLAHNRVDQIVDLDLEDSRLLLA
jgi:TPR repeat protein